MHYRKLGSAVAALFVCLGALPASAQDERTQYPFPLANSYVGVDLGAIDYPFSSVQVEPGFRVSGVEVPHTAVRLTLLGHRFNPYLSAEVTYMRPVYWVRYLDVNGSSSNRSVWMNVAGFPLRGTTPRFGRFSLDAEAGPVLVTRSGFKVGSADVVKDANYWTVLVGGGLRYRIDDSFQLSAKVSFSPANPGMDQPHTLFFSGGFTYDMRPLPPERVRENARAGYVFPHNLLQLGYATNGVGNGVNDFVSKGAIPIFWGGSTGVARGFSIAYQRNIFHSRKMFSFDWGAAVSVWRTAQERRSFYTWSLYPVLRFTPVHTGPADFYFNYSVAGPTSISKTTLDGHDLGRHFTFQDFMGLGTYLGKQRAFNAEVRIGHYSNGNLFPRNAGVSIPLTFNLGLTF